MSEKGRRFRYDAMYALIGRVAIFAVSMVYSIYFSRLLLSEGKGELAIVNSVASIFAQFCNLGLHSAHTYYVSKDRGLQGQAEGNIIIVFIMSIFVGLVSFPILLQYPNLVKMSPQLLALALVFFTLSLALMLQQNLYLAIGNIKQYNLLQIIPNVLLLSMSFLASIWCKIDVGVVAAFNIVCYIFTILFSLFDKSFVKPVISFTFLKKVLPYGMKVYVSCLVTFLLLRTDMMMLNYYLSKSEVGLYSLAVNISDMLYMLSGTITAVLFPKLSACKKIDEKINMFKKVMFVMVPLMILAALFMGVLAKVIIVILYGNEYIGSVPLIKRLLVASVAWGWLGLVNNFLASENRFWEMLVASLIGFVLNIVINYFLIPVYGAAGAALASNISYVFVFCVVFFCFFKYIRSKRACEVSE